MADRKGHRHNRTPPRRQQTLTSKPATIFTQSTSARKLPLVSKCAQGHTHRHASPFPDTRAYRPPQPFLPSAQHRAGSKGPALASGHPKAPGKEAPQERVLARMQALQPTRPPPEASLVEAAVLHPRPSSPSPATRHPGKRWDPGHHASVENEDDIDRHRSDLVEDSYQASYEVNTL